MPPPDDGNQHLPFVDLIKLEKIDEATFQSIALPFSPGGQLPGAIPRAYGGHVYAQAAWAAAQTVANGFLLYNVVGSFILPGSRTVPFVYTVEKIQDARSYCARTIKVTQLGSKDICFTCTCSFKTVETSLLDVQEEVDLWKKYKAALDGKRPQDFEPVPGVDIPWYWQLQKDTGKNDDFPGLQCTKAEMRPYNKDRHPLDRSEIMFYRPIGPLPPDANMHLCAHLYASDRNSLYIVTNHMDVGDLYTSMSSLLHMTVFHSPMEDLWFGPSQEIQSPMDDISGGGKWFAKEDWTDRSSSGRATFHSRVWSSDGSHIATLMQDGMIRYSKKAIATSEERSQIERRKRSWKPREML